MSDYQITCCSTADMTAEYLAEKNIPFACFHFHMDGKDYLDDLGKTIPFDEFYARIAAGAMPVTSQVNPEELIALFTPILESGQDVLHISLSSGISGGYSSACIARDTLRETFPERTVRVVDSLAASTGYGMLVDEAWHRQQAGATLQELGDWLDENKVYLHHWFFSTDLTHYRRGGRISPTAAVLGGLLNICPLMNVDDKGGLCPRRKVRGKNQVMREMVKEMVQHAQNGRDYAGKCMMSHSACLEDARKVADLIEAEFPHLDGKVLINSVGAVIGSHTGPGTVALFFWGDRREP